MALAKRMGHKQIEAERVRVMNNYQLFNQPWNNRNRKSAIEAVVVAVLNANESPLGIYHLTKAVEAQLDWAPRAEVDGAIKRMIASNRVVAVDHKSRTLPLYALPNAHPSTSSASIPS